MISRKTAVMAVAVLSVLPLPAFAVDRTVFQPLVGIPGVGTNAIDFDQYITAIYALTISIAALLAVVKLVIAGSKYMLSDIVSTKQSAKEDIKGALLGLIIVMSVVIILSTINTNITQYTLQAVNYRFGNEQGETTTGSRLGTGEQRIECNNRSCAGISCPSGYRPITTEPLSVYVDLGIFWNDYYLRCVPNVVPAENNGNTTNNNGNTTPDNPLPDSTYDEAGTDVPGDTTVEGFTTTDNFVTPNLLDAIADVYARPEFNNLVSNENISQNLSPNNQQQIENDCSAAGGDYITFVESPQGRVNAYICYN